MFEKITLRRNTRKGPPTAGQLAQALLFHQNVHLALDRAALGGLAQQMGVHELVEIIGRPEVNCTFSPEFLGTVTSSPSGLTTHDFGAMQFSFSAKDKNFTCHDQVAETFERLGNSKIEANRLTKKFLNRSKIRLYGSNFYVPGGIPSAAHRDARQGSFLATAMAAGLAEELDNPALAREFKFSVLPLEKGYFISSNVNWKEINERRKQKNSTLDDLSDAHLISDYLEAMVDFHLASHYGGEFETSAASSRIVRLKYGELMRRIGRGSAAVNAFQEMVLDNSAAIRECIDAGERSIADFLIPTFADHHALAHSRFPMDMMRHG
jgi:hypothetical protein